MRHIKRLKKERYGLTATQQLIPKEVTDKINELTDKVNCLQKQLDEHTWRTSGYPESYD